MRSLAKGPWGTVALVILLLLSAVVPSAVAGDRGSTAIGILGHVRTGDSSDIIRNASVWLFVFNETDDLTYSDITLSDEEGAYSFDIPANEWELGWNATLRSTYVIAGVSTNVSFQLTGAVSEVIDIVMPWNRTVATTVTVEDEVITTSRDGQATFVVNVENGGNDTDQISLWAESAEPTIILTFHPVNRTELEPGEDRALNVITSRPMLPPGDYRIDLSWASGLYDGEGGTIQLTWRVTPEVDILLPSTGVTWWPDPLFQGDDAVLNCTVVNQGRDAAVLANVSMWLTHPQGGLIIQDRVRLDVPALGSARASFPWKAVYSAEAYLLRFEVDHPLDIDVLDNTVEVPLLVGVNNQPPSVEFLAPANGTHVNGTVDIELRVTDPDTPIQQVSLRVDDGAWIHLGASTNPTYSWDTTQLEDGWYLIEAFGTDRYADGSVVRLELKVENMGPNTPPEVFIEIPQEDDVVTEVLQASGITFDVDDHVELVETRVDGGAWTLADGTTRWSASISTASLTTGPHLLEVRADDGIDLSQVASVLFHVTDLPAVTLDLRLEADPATVLPKELVTVRGELVYDNGLRAGDVLVRIEGPGGLLVFKSTDARGAFELSVTAPASEGRYYYTASATDDESRTASNTTPLRVLRSLDPDLAVLSVHVESDKVAVGTNVTVAVELGNLGFKSGNGTMRAWAGPPGTGDPIEERSVTVYDSITVSFVWVPVEAGDVDLTVEIVGVLPADANASNNRLSELVIVQVLPDLWVESIVLSNPTPYDNTSITVSIRVGNLGGLNASCTVKLYMDGQDPEQLVGEADVGVSGSSFVHATFDIKVVQGPHRLYVELVNAYPEESVVDNNIASRKFEVKGPFEPPKKDGSGGPIPGIGAALALTAIALLATIANRRPRG